MDIIALESKVQDGILNMITPDKWASKTSDDIINDITNFITKVAEEDISKNQPYWSEVPIEDKEERDRLERCRAYLSFSYFGDYYGPIYFLGYKSPEREGIIVCQQKVERWYVAPLNMIVEVKSGEPELKLEFV